MNDAYSPGIDIQGKTLVDQVGTDLPHDAAAEFIRAARAALDEIKATPMGAELLKQIDGSGHVVSLLCVSDEDEGNCEISGSSVDEKVCPLDALASPGRRVLSDVLDRSTYGPNPSARSKADRLRGPYFMDRAGVARMVGLRLDQLTRMETPNTPIPDSVQNRLKVRLYDFLTPGPGCDCQIILNPVRTSLSVGHKRYLPAPSEDWRRRPVAVGLAHELVHAWRAMKGMVLFPYGQEEEQMTVGLPPFSFMKFTENTFRVQYDKAGLGLAVRPDYSGLASKTDLLKGQATGVDPVTKKWQGDPRSLQSPLRQALARQRARAGYGDDA
jgi:hypothetical protein